MIHLLPDHPYLKKELSWAPEDVCYDLFALFYHNYTDVLDRLKATCSEHPSCAARLVVAATNFAYNQLAPWVNLNKKPADKKTIVHLYPVTLQNVVWLLLSTDVTESFPRDFGVKTLLPLLFHESRAAYDVPEVNAAIAHMLASAAETHDMDAPLLAMIREFPDKLGDYKAGRTVLANFFIGEAIKRTKNKSPELRTKVAQLLEIA